MDLPFSGHCWPISGYFEKRFDVLELIFSDCDQFRAVPANYRLISGFLEANEEF